MSKFRDKLARLGANHDNPVGPDASNAPNAPSAPGSSPASPADAKGAAGAADAVDELSNGPQVLATLKRQLGRLTAGAEGRADRTVARFHLDAPADYRLPFVVDVHGAASQRLPFELGHRVGVVALASALQADPSLLSLLALTPEITRCEMGGALYVDTETTGFAGAGTLAFLVGLCWFDTAANRWVFEQFFLAEPGDEAALLQAVTRRFAAAAFVVSYNGKSFDVPLLQSRCVLNRLEPLPPRPHVDLLHLVRRVHRSRPWRKTLAAVEREVLRLRRGPDVAGQDIAERYSYFLRSGEAAPLAAVVEHNIQDVLSMVALIGFYAEPLNRLAVDELADMARVMKRAGALDRAMVVAEAAVAREPGASAWKVRAEIAKARGDKGRALADFERLAEQIDDPAVRLELAKLYEHHVKAPLKALRVITRGTSENSAAHAHRRERLEQKAKKKQRQKP